MPSPTHSVESPLPLFSFFTPSVYVRKSPAAWKSQAYNRLLTHKQARSPATGLTAGLFLSRFYSLTLATPLSMSWGETYSPVGRHGDLTLAALLKRSSEYILLLLLTPACARSLTLADIPQASTPLGAMASRSMECCAAPLVLASNSPVGSREVLTISLPEILHRRATLRLVPPPTAHDLYS